jgi:hypothetical protein
LTPEERKTRDRQRANDRQKAYERRREDEDFKKVRSDRYKTGYRTPADAHRDAYAHARYRDADAPLFTGKRFIIKFFKKRRTH